jgi:hypothetical protein
MFYGYAEVIDYLAGLKTNVMQRLLNLILLALSVITLFSCNPEEDGYDCYNNGCYAEDNNPQYQTLEDCLSVCDNNTDGYNCINGDCNYTSSNAQYTSYSNCQNDCGGGNSTSGYNCVNNECVSVSSNAQYGSLYACTSSSCEDEPEPTTGSLQVRVNADDGSISSMEGSCMIITAYELSVSTVSGVQSGSGGYTYFYYDNLEAGSYSLSLHAWCMQGEYCNTCDPWYINEYVNSNITVIAGMQVTVIMSTY